MQALKDRVEGGVHMLITDSVFSVLFFPDYYIFPEASSSCGQIVLLHSTKFYHIPNDRGTGNLFIALLLFVSFSQTGKDAKQNLDAQVGENWLVPSANRR